MKLSKRLGQHFLHEESILEFEAALADPEGRTVLEIGPGDGRLTRKILEKGPKRLAAVEKDPRWAGHMREEFGGKVTIIEGDFLKEQLPESEIIIGNIPYYISSPILFRIAKMDFSRAILMVQHEFAKRMVAEPGTKEYGRLSVTTQLLFSAKLVKKVGKGAFTPPPKVDSAILLLKRRGFGMEEGLEKLIRVLFQHKNQKVRNALRHGGIETEAELPEKRPRELTKEEILEIYEILRNRSASPGE